MHLGYGIIASISEWARGFNSPHLNSSLREDTLYFFAHPPSQLVKVIYPLSQIRIVTCLTIRVPTLVVRRPVSCSKGTSRFDFLSTNWLNRNCTALFMLINICVVSCSISLKFDALCSQIETVLPSFVPYTKNLHASKNMLPLSNIWHIYPVHCQASTWELLYLYSAVVEKSWHWGSIPWFTNLSWNTMEVILFSNGKRFIMSIKEHLRIHLCE